MTPKKFSYTSTEAAKILNIPLPRFQDWMARGFIKPSEPSEGQGKKAIFSILDLYSIRVFQGLLSMGLDRTTSARVLQHYRDYEDRCVTSKKTGKTLGLSAQNFVWMNLIGYGVKDKDGNIKNESIINFSFSDDSNEIEVPKYPLKKKPEVIHYVLNINIAKYRRYVNERLKELGYETLSD